MKKLFIIFIILAFASHTFAASPYYIDCTHGGTDAGTFENPYKTPASAQAAIVAGVDGDDFYFKKETTCTLNGGTQRFSLSSIDGVGANYTTLGCYEAEGDWCEPGEYATIDGDGTYPASTYNGIIYKASGAGVHGRIEIFGLHVTNTSTQTGASGIRIGGNSDGLSVNLYIHDNLIDNIAAAVGRKGMVITDYHGSNTPEDILIEDNIFVDIDGGGGNLAITFDANGSYTTTYNFTIRGNTFRDCDNENIGLYKGVHDFVVEKNVLWGGDHYNIYLDQARDAVIRYNLVYADSGSAGSGRGIQTDAEGQWEYCYYQDIEIYGNIVIGMGIGIGIVDNNDCNPTGILSYNNTLIDNNNNFYNHQDLGSLTIKNNISVTQNGASNHTNGCGTAGITWDNNLFDSDPGVGNCDENPGVGDPPYADPLLNDDGITWRSLTGGVLTGLEVSLTSSSPVIDKAVPIVGYNSRIYFADYTLSPPRVSTADVEDMPFGTGEYPDIGAWEYIFNAGK